MYKVVELEFWIECGKQKAKSQVKFKMYRPKKKFKKMRAPYLLFFFWVKMPPKPFDCQKGWPFHKLLFTLNFVGLVDRYFLMKI